MFVKSIKKKLANMISNMLWKCPDCDYKCHKVLGIRPHICNPIGRDQPIKVHILPYKINPIAGLDGGIVFYSRF